MKKLQLLLLLTFIVCVASGQNPSGYYYATDSIVEAYPNHKKGHFYYEGEILNMRGVNWFGIGTHECDPHGLWALSYVDLLQNIKDVGFNAIRFVVNPEVFINHINGTDQPITCVAPWFGANSYLSTLNEYEVVHEIIQKCDDLGIYVLIDHHDAGFHNGLWYDPTNVTATVNQYLESMVMVADSFAQYDNVIGIDIFNEPYAAVWNGTGADNDLRAFANRAGDSIMAHNPNWMVFIPGVQYCGDPEFTAMEQGTEGCNNAIGWGENLAPYQKYPISLPSHKVVYTPHSYQHVFGYINEFNIDSIDNFLPSLNEWRWGHLTENYAVMPGEFGVGYTEIIKEKWFRHFVKYMAEKKLPGTFYWSINGNDQPLSIIEDDYVTVKEEKMHDLRVLYGIVEEEIDATGGEIYSPRDFTSYTFDAGTLPIGTEVLHMASWSGQITVPALGNLNTILHEFNISSTQYATANFNISVEYTDDELGSVDELKLSFYRHDGTQWVRLQSILDTANNTISTLTDQFGDYAVLGGENVTSMLMGSTGSNLGGFYYASQDVVEFYPNHKQGNVYHNGNLVNLRGVNWFSIGVDSCDAHGLGVVDYTALLQNVKDMGFNAVRLVYSSDVIENHINGTDQLATCVNTSIGNNSSLAGLNEFELLQTLVAKCEEMELYVLLAHQKDAYAGNLWYDANDAINTTAQYIEELVMVADSFAPFSNVIGIDIVNEPFGAVWNGSNAANDFRAFVELAGTEILNHNPYWMIFVQGVQHTSDTELTLVEQSTQGGNNQFGQGENLAGVSKWGLNLPANKVVFSPQTFNYNYSFVTTSDIASIESNLNQINDWRWGYLAEEHGLVPGGFGIGYQEYAYAEDWFEYFVEYLAETKVAGSFYTSLNGNDSQRGLLNTDFQTVKMDKLNDLRVLFGWVKDTLPVAGGQVYSPRDFTTYTFGAGCLPAGAVVEHKSSWSGQTSIPSFAPYKGILHQFEVVASDTASSEYQITIQYTDNELGLVDESILVIYHYNGLEWVELATTLDTATNTLSASTNEFGYFAVLENDPALNQASAGAALATGYYFATDEVVAANPDHKRGHFYHDGELINVRGVNWYDIGISECDLPGLWAYSYSDLLMNLKSKGFNALRIIYSGNVVRDHINGVEDPVNCVATWVGDNGLLSGQSTFDLLRLIVAKCEQLGMYVVLAHHDEIYANNMWYDAANVDSTKNEYINNLINLTEQLKPYSNIIGVDLIHNPKDAVWNGAGAVNDLRDFYNQAGDSVLSHNPNWMIFAEGVRNTGDPALSAIEQSNLGGNNQISWGENLAGAQDWPLSLPQHKIVFAPHSNNFELSTINENTIDTIYNHMTMINDWRWGYLADDYAVMPATYKSAYNLGVHSEATFENFVKYMAESKLPGSFYYTMNGIDGYGITEGDFQTMRAPKYNDLLVLYGVVADTLDAAGGSLYSPRDATTYTFPAGSLPANTTVKHTSWWSEMVPIPELDEYQGILHEFKLTLGNAATSDFTIEVEYTDNELGNLNESLLSFYKHDGVNWIQMESLLDTANNHIEMDVDQGGYYAVLQFDSTIVVDTTIQLNLSGFYYANDAVVAQHPDHKKGHIYKDGELVNFRGVGWKGIGLGGCDLQGLWAHDYTDFLQNVKDEGFNALRLDFNAQIVRDHIDEDADGITCIATYIGNNNVFSNATHYEGLHLVLSMCEQIGLDVLLANHHSVSAGNLWCDPVDPINTKYEFIENLVYLANDLKQYSNIIGIDLAHEPNGAVWNGSNSYNDFRAFVNEAGDSILANNPDIMVFIEGITNTNDPDITPLESTAEAGWNQFSGGDNLAGMTKWPVTLPSHKIVFSPHNMQTNNTALLNNNNADTLENFIPRVNEWRFGFLTEDYAVMPSWFGTDYPYFSYGEQWLEHFVEYMAEKKMPGSFYYTLNGNEGNGLLEGDWATFKTDKLEDMFVMYGVVEDTLGVAGGTIYSPRDGTTYSFGAGVLSDTTVIKHSSFWSGQIAVPELDGLKTILHEFELTSSQNVLGNFTIEVEYTDNELGNVEESSLSFFLHDGTNWVAVAGTNDAANNTIQLTTNQFGMYAVLGTMSQSSTVIEIAGCMDPTSLNYAPNATIDDGSCRYAPEWDVIVNSESHSIQVPGNAAIMLDNRAIAQYDYLGVFYDSLGVEKCGGFIQWDGSTQTMVAYGSEFGNDGFAIGEDFRWKIWDAQQEITYLARVGYDATFPNKGAFVHNGSSALTQMIMAVHDAQTVSVHQGWNIISTHIEPYQPNLDSLFLPMINDVILVKNAEGDVYWPDLNLNLIGTSENGQGYMVKSASNTNLVVEGYRLEPELAPIDIPAGWSMVAYLRNNAADLVAMMSAHANNIYIMKDDMGDVYWPSLNVNAIGDLTPGKGYQIYAANGFELTYPSNNASLAKSTNEKSVPVQYGQVAATDNNMTLGLLLEELNLAIGSEIAAYTQDGRLVGSAVATDEKLSMALWGDDESTDEVDGLQVGEQVVLKLWDGITESTLVVREWLQGDGAYQANKIAIAAGFELQEDCKNALGQNYPNPFSTNTQIDIEIAHVDDVTITLYSVTGKKVAEIFKGQLDAGTQTIDFFSEGLDSGTYYYKLTTSGYEETRKMSIIR